MSGSIERVYMNFYVLHPTSVCASSSAQRTSSATATNNMSSKVLIVSFLLNMFKNPFFLIMVQI